VKPAPNRIEGPLHDLTNALAAARSYGEIAMLRLKNGKGEEMEPVLTSLLKELDRLGELARTVRAGNIEEYQPGDVLACGDCGYTFVHRKATGKAPHCRRCSSKQIAHSLLIACEQE
jgi:predicted Zn-ribbon and HTH transcriptional regulator